MKLMCCVSVLLAGLSTISVTGLTYRAEGYFAIGYEVFESYVHEIRDNSSFETKRTKAYYELKKDVMYILNEVDNLFQNFHSDFKIEIYFTLRPNLLSFYEPYVKSIPGEELLYEFDKFLEINSIRRYIKYDFAVLWTGFHLFGETGQQSTVAGYARVGHICRDTATAVVEFDGTYLTALTTAHEIAHLLGTYHRNPASEYIMTPSGLKDAKNRWYFSNCTFTDIKEYLESLSNNCLLQNNNYFEEIVFDYGGDSPKMLDVDVICRRATKFSESHFFRIRNHHNYSSPRGDILCDHLLCTGSEKDSIIKVIPSEGMVCDSGKICKKGRCIRDSTARTIIGSDCLFGDQPLIRIGNEYQTCKEFLNARGSDFCNIDSFKDSCCVSCNVSSEMEIQFPIKISEEFPPQ